jgi:hypothetical protein
VALVVSEGPVEPAVQVPLVVSGDPVEPAVQEDPVEPAVQESPVAPERELVQVEAVLVLDRPRVRLAVAPKTKSVTAVHPHDLVPLLEAAEDLVAAVAVTTRDPAVAEAVIAWEVAVTAVAEAGIAVAAAAAADVAVAAADVAVADVAAAAEEVGDKRVIDGEKL